LGRFETIDQHYRAAFDAHQTATEQMLEGLAPELGQTIQSKRWGMEKVQEQ